MTIEKLGQVAERKKNIWEQLGEESVEQEHHGQYTPEAFADTKYLPIVDFESHFEGLGADIKEPMNICINGGTTLFVSSGVQLLDDCIHNEAPLPENKMFVAQPVLRSQFIGSNAIESHTSFYNLSLLETQCDYDRHLANLEDSLNLLKDNGFDKQYFSFVTKEDSPRWGKRKFNNKIIKVFYGGLEIGDAVFVPEMPQDNRAGFTISDIGFGLERINHKPGATFTRTDDCARTLALLEQSGVVPSNKEHGYRYRLFSKKFVEGFDLDYQAMISRLASMDKDFAYWGQEFTDEGAEHIAQECERNFNREISEYLASEFNIKNRIPINQTTSSYLAQLEQVDILTDEEMAKLLERINYHG